MPELDDALTALAAWLDRHGLPYMVIGGFAVTIWGEPRFTRDLDVTISVPAEKLLSTIGIICSDFASLVANPEKFVTETRVLPIVVRSVPVDLVFAALPYEDAQSHARNRSSSLLERFRSAPPKISSCTKLFRSGHATVRISKEFSGIVTRNSITNISIRE